MDQKVNFNSNVASEKAPVKGVFTDFKGERFYKISHVNQMPAFFMSIVSDSDHWLFVSSNSGLTAGRVSAHYALFPYQAVDKVQDAIEQTGNKTIIRCKTANGNQVWEPFAAIPTNPNQIERNLYKSVLGNKLCFEEVHHSLQMTFRFTWHVSDAFGFVIESELLNDSDVECDVDVLDGLQNILPAEAPKEVQTNASNLVDAYRLAEIEQSTGVGIYSLYSGITDKPQPVEVLKANVVFSLGLDAKHHLLSSQQLNAFRNGQALYSENMLKGIRNAYFISSHLKLSPRQSKSWMFIANVHQSQSQIECLVERLLQSDADVKDAIQSSVKQGSKNLQKLMAQADACQSTALENEQVHHYSNVLFNTMRGGTFDDHYQIDTKDFVEDIRHFNRAVYQKHRSFLESLPKTIEHGALGQQISTQNDTQLQRLFAEYLPITFGRRHGDPSRPWNQFSIKIRDENGDRLLSYEGNWRDIFQNWEALLLSYPEFTESVISKFVNASTVDGFNPYRITKKGIDWEIEDPKDPWSYIGYWGDHQIIYLLKLLEWSQKFHPERLQNLLHSQVFSYANVPYRIASFADIVQDPKNTVAYDERVEELIQARIEHTGADGKLVWNAEGEVYQVNLLEKLIVPLLSKLSNFVLRGGIWLNTQRPEWNDANNALVGQGLSMVTLYYMRRYIAFMTDLLASEKEAFQCTRQVAEWLLALSSAIKPIANSLITASQPHDVINDEICFEFLRQVGRAASHYRQSVYVDGAMSQQVSLSVDKLQAMLSDALLLVDDSIHFNQREDGLFHAYNLLNLQQNAAKVEYLYEMLEGQVSALSAGTLEPEEVVKVLEGLFASDMYRADQKTFMLYPDEPTTSFLQKNVLSVEEVHSSCSALLNLSEQFIFVERAKGQGYRFHADITSLDVLQNRLQALQTALADDYSATAAHVIQLYQKTFNHSEFTGRSHGMFGFEGLGCIYWHMVSKLLLASQEAFFAAVQKNAAASTVQRLGELYYQIREGIGFNKTPDEYGAFPYDPYSHTPKHSGAQQPGMTGQVKEEVLTRFGELGVHIQQGAIEFDVSLLRTIEFKENASEFEYVALNGEVKTLPLPEKSLAFTLCQVPVIYRLDSESQGIFVQTATKTETFTTLQLPNVWAEKLFKRTGEIQFIVVMLDSAHCFQLP